jgi:hypothetical protein
MAGKLTASIIADPSSATDNITLGATGNVTLGAAATVTGAASVGGLLTVGSSGVRMVNGSNTTNIVAPSTAVTTTLTLPATTGTVALTSDIPSSGGFTLLGTVNTNSGTTTATLSGLTLTGYKTLYVILNGVTTSGSGGQTTSFGTGAINTTAPTGTAFNMIFWVDLTLGVAMNGYTSSGAFLAVSTGYSTASTSLVLTTSKTWTAGTMTIYGVK